MTALKNSPDSPQASPAPMAYRQPSTRRELWLRFRKNRPAVLGSIVVCLLVLVALFAPFIAQDPLKTDYALTLRPPNSTHWFGTDDLGRDFFSRMVYGARNSLTEGVLSVAIAIALGLPIGLVSGYYRGWLDEVVIMRITDALQAVPFLFLALATAAVLGPGLWKATIAIGIGFAPAFIRMVRGQVLSQRDQDYVQAAKALGASDLRIIFRHVLPNILGPLVVQSSMATASAIIAEASLSYLGLGVQPPDPAWGSTLRFAQGFLGIAPWMALWPGIAIFVTVMSINLLGEGLRDMFDPKMKDG